MSIGGSSTDTSASRKSAKSSQKTIDRVNPEIESASSDALDFTKNFFDTYITPMIGQLNDATQTAQDRNTEVYNLQKQQAADFKDEYDTVGKPAIDQYGQTIKDFSTDEYADTQARLGIGDVRNQQQIADASTARAIAATGANAGSPAAMAIKNQNNVSYAVAAAAQAARARDLATTQKINLQASGANLGVQLGQQSTTAASGLGTTVGQGAAIPANNLQAASGAQQAQYAGYDTAIKGYGTVLDAASGINKQAVSDQTKAASDESSGWGSALGTVIGAVGKIGAAYVGA